MAAIIDIHLNNIKKLNESYKEVWTQSDKLKQLYLDNRINDNKKNLSTIALSAPQLQHRHTIHSGN